MKDYRFLINYRVDSGDRGREGVLFHFLLQKQNKTTLSDVRELDGAGPDPGGVAGTPGEP